MGGRSKANYIVLIRLGSRKAFIPSRFSLFGHLTLSCLENPRTILSGVHLGLHFTFYPCLRGLSPQATK